MWNCPACDRQFGRVHQGHVCSPAVSPDAYFAKLSAADREIYSLIADHLLDLGKIVIEPVGVGILFKRGRTFVELRPRRVGMVLSFVCNRAVPNTRVSRHLRMSSGRVANFVPLRRAVEVDETLLEWLTESFHAAEVKAKAAGPRESAPLRSTGRGGIQPKNAAPTNPQS